MIGTLPCLIAVACIFCSLITRKKLFGYIEQNYPEEWTRAARNPMKMRLPTVRAVYVQESLKHGYLAEVGDPLIQKYRRRESILAFVGAIAVVVQIIYTYYN